MCNIIPCFRLRGNPKPENIEINSLGTWVNSNWWLVKHWRSVPLPCGQQMAKNQILHKKDSLDKGATCLLCSPDPSPKIHQASSHVHEHLLVGDCGVRGGPESSDDKFWLILPELEYSDKIDLMSKSKKKWVKWKLGYYVDPSICFFIGILWFGER